MKYTAHQIPLFVDLDGTLVKSDILLESVLILLKRNPLYLFLLPFWLLRGRANLKHQLAQRVEVPCDLLPLNPELLAYLHDQRVAGRTITLISASNETAIRGIAARVGVFDAVIGSSATTNLRGEEKLARIQQECATDKFAYAGNSSADLPIWAHATEVLLVNCSKSTSDSLLDRAKDILQFDTARSAFRCFVRAMRPHQWLKNGLIFIPLVLSHQLGNFTLLVQATIGFVSFSLCASSVYLLNDLLDLNSDREHPRKRLRPFASGDLPLLYGFIGAPLLLVAAVLIALPLPLDFLYVLAFYWVVTCLYSFWFKRLLIIDTITLAALYTLRIIAGSAAIGVVTTNWLLAFSLCLFFGLALLKRFTELTHVQTEGRHEISGRAYTVASLRAISIAGACSSLLAVVVFAFYINAPDITELYSMPSLLWLICPLLLYLVGRIWSIAHQGKLNEDPILFAIADRRSQLATILCAAIIWAAI